MRTPFLVPALLFLASCGPHPTPPAAGPVSVQNTGPWIAHTMTGELFWHECGAAQQVGSYRRVFRTLGEAATAG